MGRASGDDQTWGRYTTDDFIAIDSTGTATKAQRMSQIRAKTNTAFPAGSESDVKHLIHGDTVIRTFLVGNIRQTAIWVKQKDQWLVALAQQTLLKKSQ